MLIADARVVTYARPNALIDPGAVRVEGTGITDVGSSAQLRAAYPGDEVISAGGQLVMPGNICAHTHFYGAFARGLATPGEAPRDFPEILDKLWWRLDKALTLEDVRYSALVCLVDAIKHGTTTLIDHHASPNAIGGSLDTIAGAVESAGLRANLCYEVTDRDGTTRAKEGIAENVRFAQALNSANRPLLTASFGLHASITLSDETLEACVAAAGRAGCGLHAHAAEGVADQEDSLRRSGKRVIERFADAGILGPKSILAHCVHVDAWELELLRDSGTWVTHQPRSNMNNAVGAAPVETMLRGGIRLGLGNDGFSNNMWAEWKAAYLMQKLWHGDPRRMDGNKVLEMAAYNNAALATTFWPETSIGELSPGAEADLIVVDYHPFTALTAGNLPWHILFGFDAGMVTGTMVAGRWLMRDRKLLTLDEEAIVRRARECSAAVWQRYAEIE
ncbi:MAG: putative aminohydrolase SsnA [Anaerolineae bacterium]